jgi:hypothetical protein
MKLFLVFVALLTIAVVVATARSADEDIYLEDGNRYTPVHLTADHLMICTMVAEGKASCMELPPGTVLLIPQPETAPVDSL